MTFPQKSTLVAFALICLSAFGTAAEKKIAKSSLPPAVVKTVQEQSQGATVRGYTQDSDHGKTEYEVEMTVDGHSKDVSIAADGSVLEVEEQVQMAGLPATVQAGLSQKAGSGKITKIESITKHGAIVAYEAQVMTQGKHKEIQVGPNGQALDHEE